MLLVTLGGDITEVVAFDNIVPSGLATRGNTVYVAQASPVPHLSETGKVVSFGTKSPSPQVVASGARLIVDVEFGRGGSLYALSQGEWDGVFPGDPAAPDTGALVLAKPDGTFTVIEDDLDRPSSLEVIGKTAYVVTLTGEVWKIDVPGRSSGGGAATAAASLPDAALALFLSDDDENPTSGSGVP